MARPHNQLLTNKILGEEGLRFVPKDNNYVIIFAFAHKIMENKFVKTK